MLDDVKRDYKLVHEEQEDYGSLIYNQTDGYEQAKAFQYLVHERIYSSMSSYSIHAIAL